MFGLGLSVTVPGATLSTLLVVVIGIHLDLLKAVKLVMLFTMTLFGSKQEHRHVA